MGGRGAKSPLGSNNVATKPKEPRPLALGETAYIPEWFRGKMGLPDYALTVSEGLIVDETEKAWKLSIDTVTADGERDLYYEKWIPKSVAKSYDQVNAEYQRQEQRFERGKQRYEAMINFAKKKKIKGVRTGLRKETVLKKIKEAGYEYDYYKN